MFLIEGVSCPKGHFTDGNRLSCMVCGAQLGPHLTRYQAARPKLGDLVFDDGRELPLDGSYLIGAAPPSHLGTRTVSLADAGDNHLSIRLDGWTVCVHNLDTTSGTEISYAEGDEFHGLPPGAVVDLHPGMTLRLAGRATITYRGRDS
ncbi:hypothetical protein [Nonomuraea sp. C10]|uniref:hypothetical protein n=1 Tax=Nonomuraea sp. C10 TaxID=2600577 RepID=UPI0011CE88A5|nr:hypothetical protein [Nonomuraea sp. C10]TXK33987.1 hypothetical protein FR742_31725 [Nonomuraea sp. C10]